MAKQSLLAREQKRSKLVKQFAVKRMALKQRVCNQNLSEEERWNAQMALQKLPRDASPVRIQRRCLLTGRPHGVYRRFGLGRNKLREHAMMGNIPGLRKASW